MDHLVPVQLLKKKQSINPMWLEDKFHYKNTCKELPYPAWKRLSKIISVTSKFYINSFCILITYPTRTTFKKLVLNRLLWLNSEPKNLSEKKNMEGKIHPFPPCYFAPEFSYQNLFTCEQGPWWLGCRSGYPTPWKSTAYSGYVDSITFTQFLNSFLKWMLTSEWCIIFYKFCKIISTVFFFMCTKVFVHLTHLKLPQICKKYLKIFVWSGHLIKIHLE